MEMSKKWKLVVGGLATLIVVLGIGLSVAGVVHFRTGLRDGPWRPRQWQETEEAPRELEVELVDDDGDGVPDRGVIELPREVGFGREQIFGGRLALGRSAFGHSARFGPGRRMGFMRRAFSPFQVVGGLVRLVVLAGAVVLGVVLCNQRRKAQPQASPASE
jgi:hypothetical protein